MKKKILMAANIDELRALLANATRYCRKADRPGLLIRDKVRIRFMRGVLDFLKD